MNYIPEIICIVGLILYFLPDQAKVNRVGEIMFIVGLIFSLWGGLGR